MIKQSSHLRYFTGFQMFFKLVRRNLIKFVLIPWIPTSQKEQKQVTTLHILTDDITFLLVITLRVGLTMLQGIQKWTYITVLFTYFVTISLFYAHRMVRNQLLFKFDLTSSVRNNVSPYDKTQCMMIVDPLFSCSYCS